MINTTWMINITRIVNVHMYTYNTQGLKILSCVHRIHGVIKMTMRLVMIMPHANIHVIIPKKLLIEFELASSLKKGKIISK